MPRSTSPGLPGSAPRRRAPRAAGVLACAALLLPLLSAAPPAGAEAAEPGALQDQFARAASRHGVPESVLLAVSYLQSRWDAHGGAPSVSGGYGPMHLTDAVTALTEAPPHHSEGTEDARGDIDVHPLTPQLRTANAVRIVSASPVS
ncbi:hypothetical protein ACWCPG_34635, partial [Streptomyces sp. NPDC001919]